MKKTFSGIIICLAITAACTKKSVPVITARTTEPSKPQTPVGDVIPDQEIGKSVFTSRCGRCHGLPEPIQYTAQKWETILITMMPRARLNKEQEVHVTAYLKANALK